MKQDEAGEHFHQFMPVCNVFTLLFTPHCDIAHLTALYFSAYRFSYLFHCFDSYIFCHAVCFLNLNVPVATLQHITCVIMIVLRRWWWVNVRRFLKMPTHPMCYLQLLMWYRLSSRIILIVSVLISGCVHAITDYNDIFLNFCRNSFAYYEIFVPWRISKHIIVCLYWSICPCALWKNVSKNIKKQRWYSSLDYFDKSVFFSCEISSILA